nr:OmpA family protein [uncultured Roseococcus sp.]
MSRAFLFATAALIGASALPFAAPAFAQNDPAARQLIERLRPSENQTRGIRMPGSDAGTVTTPAAAPSNAPTLTPASPPTGGMTSPRPTGEGRRPPPPPQTTAPAGVAAVSITVNFATGSATLTPQAMSSLTSLGRALSSPELAPFRFRIEGHTDTAGDADLNMALSQRRAEAVASFLHTRFNVAADRLVPVGMGESQLLVPTPDNVPEARNRRVQVVNVGG